MFTENIEILDYLNFYFKSEFEFLASFGIHIIREHEKIIIGAGCEDSSGRGGGVGLPLPQG